MTRRKYESRSTPLGVRLSEAERRLDAAKPGTREHVEALAHADHLRDLLRMSGDPFASGVSWGSP